MHSLQTKLRNLSGKELVIQEAAKRAREDQERLSKEISELDRLLSRKDEMLETLQHMQITAQGKNKTVFEEMLSSLIHDIIPGKSDKIVLTSSMRNNRASLDIDIMVDGNLENVDEDKGGSISNITAMGLRFIVLSRNPNRRILMFDEADCHLSREYIPAFAAVLNNLAYEMGIQVLYISHHPISCFEGYGRIIGLTKQNGRIHSRVIGEEGPAPADYTPPDSALRYIRLKNYGPHQNTLVELSPGLNIISGDVDLGKSKLIQAIADLTENKGAERRIKHKADAFEVEIGLEEGMSLHWSYSRKGSKKTKYALLDKDGVDIERSDIGNGIPDWLHTYLAMAPVNGENIHLHSQKDSSYLLSSTKYTSIERAQMLPLGRGSRDVMAMIQAFNSKVQSARSTRTRLEKEMNRAQNMLATMSLILENSFDVKSAYKYCDDLIIEHNRIEESRKIIDELERCTLLNQMYDISLKSLERQVVSQVELLAKDDMAQTIQNIEVLSLKSEAMKSIGNIEEMPKEPKLSDLAGLAAAGSRIKKLEDAVKTLEMISTISEVESITLKADIQVDTAANAIEVLQTRATRGAQVMKDCLAEKGVIDIEMKALIEEMGGLCPTCDKPIGDHAHG